MSKLPLIEGILDYVNENNVPFTMPGHKGGRGFKDTVEGKKFYDKILKCDITEVAGVDNLHNAEDIIKESLIGLSEYYHSEKSYYLVNGSTSGNLSMIFSIFNRGDKIILERNCHRSIMNGVIMRELKTAYLQSKIHDKFSCPFSLSKKEFSEVLENNKDAKGIVVTYPNYYGICIDLEYIIREASKYNMKVLVDCAHGAHFGVIDELPKNPITLGADMAVMSSHKTLSSLTQTAYLHVGKGVDLKKVDFYVSAFMSTSPSYIMMMSMEYGWSYLKQYGEKKYKEFLQLCIEYRNKINKLKGFTLIGEEHMYVNHLEYMDTNIDLTRFVISVDRGYSSHKLLNYLRENKIQGEMSDGRNIILIPTPFNCEDDFKKLYEILKKCDLNNLKEKDIPFLNYHIPKKVFEAYEVLDRQKEYVHISNSKGKVAGSNIVPYPPGIPLVVQGEVIDSEVVDVIEYYYKNNLEVLGIENEEVCIVK